MTYNEWRDELKSNLLCVSDSERRRVLDYYAEAYADRRDAGFTEREIIEDFGAPYDAAHRILNDNKDDFDEPPEQKTRREIKRENRERRQRGDYDAPPPRYEAPPPPPEAKPVKKGGNYTWVFVILCIIFCVPLFGLIVGLIGATIGICVAPIAVIAAGAAAAGSSIWYMIDGELLFGLYRLGTGLMVFGVGVIMCPLFFRLIKLLWTLFKRFFTWLNSMFSGKEYA